MLKRRLMPRLFKKETCNKIKTLLKITYKIDINKEGKNKMGTVSCFTSLLTCNKFYFLRKCCERDVCGAILNAVICGLFRVNF